MSSYEILDSLYIHCFGQDLSLLVVISVLSGRLRLNNLLLSFLLILDKRFVWDFEG